MSPLSLKGNATQGSYLQESQSQVSPLTLMNETFQEHLIHIVVSNALGHLLVEVPWLPGSHVLHRDLYQRDLRIFKYYISGIFGSTC